jgi:hypothetical protein
MSDDYVREKLCAAHDCMATSAAPIQRRLENAWISALMRLEPSDFRDDEARTLFERVAAAMATVSGGAEGSVRASTVRMSDAEGEAVARLIFDLHYHFFDLSINE